MSVINNLNSVLIFINNIIPEAVASLLLLFKDVEELSYCSLLKVTVL